MLKYRPDIDGLRALAVLSVILFHLNPRWLPGGFAGVDVFFVLSGFLITSILRNEFQAGKFSLAGFYERRARRILPALAAVTVTSLAAFYFILFPADYTELGKSAMAAMFSVSNIFFWQVIDYFSTAASEKPLLHTWSLGVEEQFYVFFPLVLWLIYRRFREKAVILTIAALSLASLVFAEISVHHIQSFAFYMLPARFWELGIGALLAFAPIAKFYSRTNNILSLAGLALLLAGFWFSNDDNFPGLLALIPCLGAALLIFAGPDTFLAEKFLSHKYAVLIGRMSYSLYLWHWPVLAAARYVFETMTPTLYITASLGIFLLSYASWRFVETPFRNRDFLSRKTIFLSSFAVIVLIGAMGAAIIIKDGFPARFSPHSLQIADAANDHAPLLYAVCQTEAYKNNPACNFGDAAQKESTILLWGDSHAESILPLMNDYAEKRHLKGIHMAKTSCPPLLGDFSLKSSGFADCRKFNTEVFAYILAHKEIKHVFLLSRWAAIAEKISVDGEREEEAFYKTLNHTAEILRENGRHVVFIASIPEIDFSVPRCLSRQSAYPYFSLACKPPTIDQYMKRQQVTLAAFSALNEDYDVFYPYKTLCKSGVCDITSGDDILYFDDDHLSTKGAKLLLPDLEKTVPK